MKAKYLQMVNRDVLVQQYAELVKEHSDLALVPFKTGGTEPVLKTSDIQTLISRSLISTFFLGLTD